MPTSTSKTSGNDGGGGDVIDNSNNTHPNDMSPPPMPMSMPDKIRVVIDQTAKYVAAKNGNRNHSRLEFEARIMKKQKKKKKGMTRTQSSNDDTNKLDFIQTTSPFREYYEGRIRYFENILTPTTKAVVAAAVATTKKTK